MNDYARVAAVIDFLDANHTRQPSLKELAAVAGLSESHFHKLFHRWAGVTPKDFLQCLTLEHAKECLRQSASVLETALEAGLSGPGRLHDLLVTIEAASPGEFKSGGQGLSIGWGRVESPFGFCTLGWSKRGICHLSFSDDGEGDAASERLRENWPNADLRLDAHGAKEWARIIFRPARTSGTALQAYVRATPFQLRVWRALLRIPSGSVVSYGRLGCALGDDGAARAVGTACGSNPVAYLIPCHRVIRETGIVLGYRWGTTRKRAMLGMEAATQHLALSPARVR